PPGDFLGRADRHLRELQRHQADRREGHQPARRVAPGVPADRRPRVRARSRADLVEAQRRPRQDRSSGSGARARGDAHHGDAGGVRMSGTQVVAALIKILVMIGFVVNTAAILTWLDRRMGGLMQDRVGPNRAVVKIFGKEFRLAGLLHPAADGLKFFTKEFYRPPRADKLLFSLAPILSMMPVMALVAVIPFGDTLCLNDIARKAGDGGTIWPVVPHFGSCSNPGTTVPLMVASLNVGLLYVFALAGQGIVGAAIAGWSSDNKYSLMGALRAASQMVSYEVAMGLTLIGGMMIYGTIRLDDMVRWQGEHTWGIFVQPLAFVLFFTAAVAETKRIPFDLPEAESELVSGYFTEYSGMTFGMFYFAEYMEVVTSSMLVVTIFLGGWELPFLHRDGLTLAFGESTLAHVAVPH